MQDVAARGLEQEILLIVTGEFGRTPRINGGPGRDHWAAVNDILFIGGGLRMGQVIGETDAKAAAIKSRPVTVQDFMATIFDVLGMEQALQYIDPSGRPRNMIDNGQVMKELV
jgi:uncharacterized protein (DUF1501 family)